MAFNWPWRKGEEQEPVADQYDEQGDEGTGYEDGAEEQEEELELDAETAALVERKAAEREKAVEAKYREALKAQGLDLAGDRVAIRDMNQFATEFGFGQPPAQQPQQAPAPKEEAPADPFAAIGPRPDPSYDAEGFDRWQAARDQVLIQQAQQRAAEAMAPQFQQLQSMFAQTQVDRATDRAKEILRSSGLGALADHPRFDEAFGQAILEQPVERWGQAEILTATAGWVLPKLGPAPAAAAQRPRDERGQYTAQDAARQSLAQVSASRDSGRPAAPPAALDPEERRLAASMGMTDAEWRHHKQYDDYESHRQFVARQQRQRR
jgi:hypothetical protein